LEPAAQDRVRAFLLDVEGTTTPLAFVREVLFPYARSRLRDFLSHSTDVDLDIQCLREEHEVDRSSDLPAWEANSSATEAAPYLQWLMDKDRKSSALKSLQGKIWERGYIAGELEGQVYPDVPPALERWHGQGRRVAIFSSGSVLAQRMLFGKSNRGDLAGWIDAYFDTTTGAKVDPRSYERIAAALRVPPETVLFISDVEGELDAAQGADMLTALCVRSSTGPSTRRHRVIRSFEGV
jgi:enolase-phosphatase E1